MVTIKKVTDVGEDMEKLESSNTASRNIKWYSLFGKQTGSSSKSKAKYYLMIPQLSVHQEKQMCLQKNVYMHVPSSINYNSQE
jgi:hypothetical protein